MNLDANDFTSLLLALMPGVIASAIFFTFTAHPVTEDYERIIRAKRVVQTFVFVGLIRFVVHLIRAALGILSKWVSWGRWNLEVDFDWSIVVAVVLGLGFAYGLNHDALHRMFRTVGLTTRSSYPTEWFAAFSTYQRYVLLHLQGGRRIRGWPEQWPDQPNSGYFLLSKPEWVVDDQVAPLHQVERFLVPASKVVMVEFLLPPDEVPADAAELKRVRDLVTASAPPFEDKHGRRHSSTGTQPTPADDPTRAG